MMFWQMVKPIPIPFGFISSDAFNFTKRLVEIRLRGESGTESDGQDRSRGFVAQHRLGSADPLFPQVAGKTLAQPGIHQFRQLVGVESKPFRQTGQTQFRINLDSVGPHQGVQL